MTPNNYQTFLNSFFKRLLELRHTSSHINSVLNQTAKRLKEFKEADFVSASSLVISDWTGQTDNGWTLNQHTGIFKIIYSKDYKKEVESIISFQCSYSFAQAFEALETFLKDCVCVKSLNDKNYLEEVKSFINVDFDRQNIPGGEKLFKLIKKSCPDSFKKYSGQNNRNIRFKEFWTVLSEARHSITHSTSIIDLSKLKKTTYHFSVFEYFFKYLVLNPTTIQIQLDYQKTEFLIKAIAEFGFQIFKILSISDDLEWDILKK